MKKRTMTKLESEFQIAIITGAVLGIIDIYDLDNEGVAELIETKEEIQACIFKKTD